MAEDLLPPEAHFRIGHDGEAGELPATVATPLAVILTELLQNAAEHAFPEGPGVAAGQVPPGHEPLRVHVSLQRDDGQLLVQVRDNGRGLPEGFSIEESTSLGLSIVRDLVRTQLGGRIDMRTDGGTVVDVIVPTTAQADDDESLPAPP
jgi:two-component sensor histidine kinase